MSAPKELSIAEIRNFMLSNDCKVTNHALVKHFKCFLTNPSTQNVARTRFKTSVNILATIKNENNQKYLILRKKYLHQCPSEEIVQSTIDLTATVPSSPGENSLALDASFRTPPPYTQPPRVEKKVSVSILSKENDGASKSQIVETSGNYRDCVEEFTAAMKRIDPNRIQRSKPENVEEKNSEIELTQQTKINNSSNSNSEKNNKENIPRFSFSSTESNAEDKTLTSDSEDPTENPISVKEATRKFNRMASEEEAKIVSPSGKNKPEKFLEEKVLPEVNLSHPKAKEWIVSMAKASYQELAKLANASPELVKLQDPATGYTALHWAAKHGNEDIVKLIAGTYKADVNARSNGGYTPLHLAMQFKSTNVFQLLCNTYKANRDMMDWSGNKPLDYSQQHTTVSASTYSSEYTKDNSFNYFDYLNFQNVTSTIRGRGIDGGSGTLTPAKEKKRSELRYATISVGSSGFGTSLSRTQSLMPRRQKKEKVAIQSVMYAPKNLVIQGGLSKSHRHSNYTNHSIGNSDNNYNDFLQELGSPELPQIRSALDGEESIYNDKKSTHMSSARRKESFLHKKLRSTIKKTNYEVNTNQTLME